ncbi:MAG: tetratricopeptide repeat protein [Acidobacteriia bacterium]|nr:tetratricopeptide repeat protein [Terriglobia bacterium]
MKSCCLILIALLLPPQHLIAMVLPPQHWGVATVSGRILDREGNPLVGAEIVYKNVGIVDRHMRKDPAARVETPTVMEGTGRVYKVKTDKKGAFVMIGVDYGVYEIEITASDGSHVYSGKKNIGEDSDINVHNILNVDLSTATREPVVPGGETNLAAGKKTKEQLELIRQENSNAAKINRLISRFHTAMELEAWGSAIDLLQQLIVLDRNRWEFYQNLGTLQMRQMRYQEAAESFARGVEVAEKILANPSDTDRALKNVIDLLLAEADCDNRIDKVDEAVALYDKAAALSTQPATSHYLACNALMNHGKTEAAIEKCSQAIADDPTQWEYYQALGGALNNVNKQSDALQAYEKGVAAARKILEEKPDSGRTKTGLGQMLNAEGNLLVQLKKYDEAIGPFTQASEMAAYPALPYFNLCATYYNLKREQEALPACERAISSDPSMADAYYIKASILFGQGTLEHGKYVVPPGTSESLNKYLEYAPFGERAAAVRSMIDKLNEEIDFKAQTPTPTPYNPARK